MIVIVPSANTVEMHKAMSIRPRRTRGDIEDVSILGRGLGSPDVSVEFMIVSHGQGA